MKLCTGDWIWSRPEAAITLGGEQTVTKPEISVERSPEGEIIRVVGNITIGLDVTLGSATPTNIHLFMSDECAGNVYRSKNILVLFDTLVVTGSAFWYSLYIYILYDIYQLLNKYYVILFLNRFVLIEFFFFFSWFFWS